MRFSCASCSHCLLECPDRPPPRRNDIVRRAVCVASLQDIGRLGNQPVENERVAVSLRTSHSGKEAPVCLVNSLVEWAVVAVHARRLVEAPLHLELEAATGDRPYVTNMLLQAYRVPRLVLALVGIRRAGAQIQRPEKFAGATMPQLESCSLDPASTANDCNGGWVASAGLLGFQGSIRSTAGSSVTYHLVPRWCT